MKSMTHRARLLLTSTVAALALSVATPAQATPEVRDEMSGQAGMPDKSLPCSTCHQYANTGTGTVRTPFGFSVRTRGLDIDAQDRSTNVFDVIHKMNLDHVDSDGDGVEDMVELKNLTDPNTPGPVPLVNRDEVGNGCHCGVVGARTEPAASSLGALGLAGLAVAFVSARRATRRGRPSRA